MVELWWSTLTAATLEFRQILDPTELSRLDSYKQSADQGRFLVGAALLRHAVAEFMGVQPADVVIDRTCKDCGQQHGAPHVIVRDAKVPFVSVSHSGLLIVVAISAQSPLGVDVQRTADVTGQQNARDWVRREALFKSGDADDTVNKHILDLEAPLAGYVAALAVTTETDLNPTLRYWP